MFIKKCFLIQISALIPTLLLGVQPLGAQTSSESKRILLLKTKL